MSDTTMTTPGNAGWISFAGPDTAKAKAFYADVLGWQINEMPMQDGSSYSGIFVNDAPIGGFSPMPEEGGSWTIYVTVTDVDGATKAAAERGATVVAGPMDMPGVGRMSTIIDPQGARLAMITYESMQG